MKTYMLLTAVAVLAAFSTVQVNAACGGGGCTGGDKDKKAEQTDKK